MLQDHIQSLRDLKDKMDSQIKEMEQQKDRELNQQNKMRQEQILTLEKEKRDFEEML